MGFTLSYNATDEIRDAIDVLKWIQANIECALSLVVPKTKPDLSKLALVGHSRGGKVVLSMGIQLNGTIPISTIIGLDPVDGNRQGIQTDPPVLTFKENTLNMTVPTLIVGTRHGSENVHQKMLAIMNSTRTLLNLYTILWWPKSMGIWIFWMMAFAN
jgi:hypothetical protein